MMKKVTVSKFRELVGNCETLKHVDACKAVINASDLSNELYNELMMELSYVCREILRGKR